MEAVYLLGPPSVVREGAVAPPARGKKVWALIAYLLSTSRAPGREHVAEMLFTDADDPLRALRWTLNEARRFLPGRVEGDPLELDLVPGCVVDVDVVISGRWEEAIALPTVGLELLEGVDLSSSPGFDAWLLNERRRLRAASEAILREAALAFLGNGRYEESITSAVKLVALDPLVESYQEILIRAYAAAGDRASAARQMEACRSLFHRELGVEPSGSLETALDPGPVATVRAALRGPAAARAQLEAGEAAIRAGAFEAGLECLKRSISEAHSCGDIDLMQEALFATGSALVHAGRSVQNEGAAALHEVIELSERTGANGYEARASFELGWLEFLAASYGRAETWLQRAVEGAEDDSSLRASALTVLGKVRMETAHYASSVELLTEAVDSAPSGDPSTLGFALSSLGRTRLLMRALGPARSALESSLEILEGAGIVSLIPIPESFLAEVHLLEGEHERASKLAEHAYALAVEVGDVTKMSLSQRSLGLVLARQGDAEEAFTHLVQARRRLVMEPDHTWTMAYALDALCDLAVAEAHSEAAHWVDDLEGVGGRTGMREMVTRAYLHRAALGIPEAGEAALALAQDIDNPSLLDRAEQRQGAATRPASVDGWNSVGSSASRPMSSR